MLNAQPMGFYAPSTLVEDAKRRGVEVRPIDVNRSAWDCTLEPGSSGGELAVRMGLRYVKGLGTPEREAIDDAPPPYASMEGFARRTRLGRRPLAALAEAGAFDGFGLSRRDALWKARALGTHAKDTLALTPADARAQFRPLSAPEEVLWDYRASQHSTRAHPMERFRAELRRRRIPDAATIRRMPDGTRTDYVGMVICRQRPSTKTGVTFFTLEDETGFANLVVWRPVFDRHAPLAKAARLLGVTGRIQSTHGVLHLVTERLWEPDLPVDVDPRGSEGAPRPRNFH